ncbi:hypothetical protein [Sorangium cellulosum]|uniref:Uncharacterized protein n=1 Tax=Sorangium cellulosum TaxID=56 RepID=A0A150QFL9_SORCE|nr:hypothetical protein [Sorangium cellulosum]KYF66536.1 hypothetical protein BE15_17850 [Sorangium cellulosum]
MTLGRMMLVGCLSLVGTALVGCGLVGADRVGEGGGNVVVTPPTSEGDGCTLTQGYWKNHEESWPVSSLTIGGVAYSQEELLELFRTPPKGDASLIVGHQLIAALLNVASGASDAALGGALADAEAWMAANKDADGRLPYGVKRGSAADAAVSLSGALADFNEGGIGPGHCDDGPSSGSGSTGGGDGGDCDCDGGTGSTGGAGGSDGGTTSTGSGAGDCPHDGGTSSSSSGTGGTGGSSGDPDGGEGGSAWTCDAPCSNGDACSAGYSCVLGCCTFVAN